MVGILQIGEIMDKISIKNLEIYAYHGVLPEEKRDGQKFIVSADMYTSTRKAALEDNLEKTVNYALVCEQIKECLLKQSYNLIETVAEKVAETILLNNELVNEVCVCISKPGAPIPMTFETVEVSITRAWHKVYLSIGSNMGDKKGYLDYAVKALKEDVLIKNVLVSQYIETKPYGNVAQDDFLNACIELDTLYSPQEMLEKAQLLEQGANRERKVHWGPRTLDVDILLYDQDIIRTKDLLVPHIEMHKREFVLKPMLEIAPYAVHPVFNKTVKELSDLLM